MSSKHTNERRRVRRLRLGLVGAAVVALLVATVVAGAVTRDSSVEAAPARAAELEREISPALMQKLARHARFAPGEPAREAGEEAGDGALEWLMHAYPAVDIPLAAITGSRSDWKAVKSRGNSAAKLGDHGHWTNLGPDNAIYPLNPHRNRYVYVPNEYVAAGRTAHSVIDPNCGVAQCRYWIANAGGGIWRTDNVLAPQPAWEYVSPEFEHNNTAALELDPNDAKSETLYAGTGEPNICRSGCIAGASRRSKSRPHHAHRDQPRPTSRLQFGHTRLSRVRQVGQMIHSSSIRREQVGQALTASTSASRASSASVRS